MPDGELKLPKLQRDIPAAELTLRKAEGSRTELSFSASSEAPVDRWFGTEVLSHEKGAIRFDRMKSGAVPLLFNHDWADVIGMVDAGAVKDGRMLVDAHLFDTARAQELAVMIDGGLRNISIGYQIHTLEEDVKSATFTARDWEPLEVSIVTVPADPSIGIGRVADEQATPVRLIRADSTPAQTADSRKEIRMDPQVVAPAAGAPAEPKVEHLSADAIEAQRIEAIRKFCKANALQPSIEKSWIERGCDWNKISDEFLALKQKQSEAAPQSAAFLDLPKADLRNYSVFKAVRACMDKNWTKAGLEFEAHQAIQKRTGQVVNENTFFVPFDVQRRDLTVGTANAGGYLVETANQSFIEVMRNRSVLFNMGATRLSGLTGSVTVPKQTAAATAYWLANEAATVTESQQTFGQMALTPKTVGAYTEISRQLLLQSSPDAEGLVMADLGAVVAIAVDLAGINGSGASGQPQGIIGTAGVGSVTGTSLAAAGIIEFQTDVAAGNLLSTTCGYVTTPAVAGLLMARPELPTTGTTRMWTGSLLDGAMLGFRAMSSNQMPAANMLFGDWAKVVVAEWGVLSIEANPYANFQAGIVGIRAMYSIDIGVRYGAAFSLATSIT